MIPFYQPISSNNPGFIRSGFSGSPIILQDSNCGATYQVAGAVARGPRVSPYYLHYRFKEALGENFTAYITGAARVRAIPFPPNILES